MRLTLLYFTVATVAALGHPSTPPAGHPVPQRAHTHLTETFNGRTSGLYYTNWEFGTHTPDKRCGSVACASIHHDRHDRFLRIEVRPGTGGFSANTDVTSIDLNRPDLTDTGPYTATPGHPVKLNARIRFSPNYDLAGTAGQAQGTAGVVLWNSAFDQPGAAPGPGYDQIGFTWASSDILADAISGLTASTFVDQAPVAVFHPTGLDLHQWFDVAMVWSVDPSGTQWVSYQINGNTVGAHHLPSPLAGLSLEMWNDNQEPYLCPDAPGGLCTDYPNPNQVQSIDIDSVSVRQP